MVPAISSARAYFEHIGVQSDPFAYLSSIPDPTAPHFPFFEEEWIDFKGQPQEKDEKKIWSKALSGFANIADGLIVWGIDARKMPSREIDAASGLRLIPDPPAFESKLRDWLRDATNPPVMGVEFKSYVGPSGDGFVVCLIPESAHKPHRAEFAEKHYYYRASDDFLMIEPGMLRTLFFPRHSPNIWVEMALCFTIEPRDLWDQLRQYPKAETYTYLINKGHSCIEYEIRLYNDGTATAKDVYVVVQTKDDISIEPGVDWTRLTNLQGRAALKAGRPFHPGEVSVLFTAWQTGLLNKPGPQEGWSIIPHFDKMFVRLLMYADGAERQIAYVEFTSEDFESGSNSAVKRGVALD